MWRVKLGRCGPFSRALARLLRALLPVRGIGPLTAIVLGAPAPAQSACPAVRRLDGVAFELDLREALHRVVYLDLFSLELRRLVLPLLRPGELFVDIGANFGLWALAAARRGCPVIAVEPVPATRERLAANVRRNGLAERVEIVAAAISDAPGTLTLSLPAGESGQASVHAGAAQRVETFTVSAITLDQLIGERRVGFLKIDIEGHEPALLAGGARVLASGQVERLLIELTSVALARAGRSSGAIIDALLAHGYRFERFVRANEGLFPRGSYGRLMLDQLRSGAHAGDALWTRVGDAD